MEPPSLATAFAVARLVQARTSQAVTQAQQKCKQLEVEVEQLRAAAAVPPAPQLPLLQVVAEGEPAESSLPGQCCRDALQRQMCSLAAWHEAAGVLPPDLQAVLAKAHRYAVLCQLQQGPGGVSLLAGAVLERSPVRALLELASDILQTQAMDATAPPSEQRGRVSKLTAAHDRLLLAACTCLARLCDLPIQTVLPSDYGDLQHFCAYVLRLAAEQPLQCAADLAASGTRGKQQQERQEAPQAGPPTPRDHAAPSQACAQLAQQVLGVLRQSACTGAVLLRCLAPQTRHCMEALAAAITGEHLAGCPGTGMSGSCSALDGASSTARDGARQLAGAEAAEEGRLLHEFMQLSQQLSLGMRLLPHWVQALESCSDGFLQVCGNGEFVWQALGVWPCI